MLAGSCGWQLWGFWKAGQTLRSAASCLTDGILLAFQGTVAPFRLQAFPWTPSGGSVRYLISTFWAALCRGRPLPPARAGRGWDCSSHGPRDERRFPSPVPACPLPEVPLPAPGDTMACSPAFPLQAIAFQSFPPIHLFPDFHNFGDILHLLWFPFLVLVLTDLNLKRKIISCCFGGGLEGVEINPISYL